MQLIIKKISIFAYSILLLSSCKKDGLVNRTEPANQTRMLFVHAVPETIQFNFFTGERKITGAVLNSTSNLPQGMGYNTANQPAWFGYAGMPEGNIPLQAIVAQNYVVTVGDTLFAGNSILDTSFQIASGKPYSFFSYGTAKDVKALILEDKLVKVPDSAGIRFVNLQPNAVPVDLEITYTAPGSTTPVVSFFAQNIAYGEYANFKAMQPGAYVFQRKRTGTNTLVGSALTITRLNAGQNYTLCARGSLAAISQIGHQ